MISIVVNGDTRQVECETTVARLLEILQMNPKYLAVELNEKVVPRTEHAQVRLAADDRIEIVTLVGGG